MSARTAVGAPSQPRAVASACELHLAKQAPARPAPAFACKPNQPAPAPRQGFKATAPQGFEPRPAGAETVSIEAAPSGRSTAASRPLALFSISGGLTMAKLAPSFFYDPLKSVPLGGLMRSGVEFSKRIGKTLIHKTYTLCAYYRVLIKPQRGVRAAQVDSSGHIPDPTKPPSNLNSFNLSIFPRTYELEIKLFGKHHSFYWSSQYSGQATASTKCPRGSAAGFTLISMS